MNPTVGPLSTARSTAVHVLAQGGNYCATLPRVPPLCRDYARGSRMINIESLESSSPHMRKDFRHVCHRVNKSCSKVHEGFLYNAFETTVTCSHITCSACDHQACARSTFVPNLADWGLHIEKFSRNPLIGRDEPPARRHPSISDHVLLHAALS